MKRMIRFFIIAGLLTSIWSVVSAAAPAQDTPSGGKALYSTRRSQPRLAPQPTATVDMVDEAPVVPRKAPQPPAVPQRSEARTMPQASMLPNDFPVMEEVILDDRPLLELKNELSDTESTDEYAEELDKAAKRPLSGIAIQNPPAKTVPVKVETSKEKHDVVHNAVAESNPERTEPAEIDRFNARLARIQLEKHQLEETLKLIGKIQSPAFKVQTLVDLAEYVSRDKNYKSEADHLFELAVSGIDALAAGKPIALKMPEKKAEPSPIKSAPPKVEKPEPAKSLTLIDEDETTAPKTEPVKPTTPPAAKKPALSLIDEGIEEEKAEEKKPEAKPTPPPAAKKPALSLIDEGIEEEKAEEKKPEAKPTPPPAAKKPALSLIDEGIEDEKAEEKKPEAKPTPPPAAKKPALSLIDEGIEEEKAEEKKPEAKPTPPPAAKKPALSLIDEGIEEEKAEENKPAATRRPPPATKKPSISLIEEEDGTDKGEEAKPTRRPMPRASK